jgi:hypothetical protein
MEIYQTAPFVATNIPWAILPVLMISPIPLYLNYQIIKAYFKFDVLRKAPSDILTTLAVVYGLRDIFFILMVIISLFFSNEDNTEFNSDVCKVMASTSYIILYLVYTYSSALNIFLGMATGTTNLYTDESTKVYHYSAIIATSLLVIPLFFSGSLYQTPVTICVYTLGAADGIIPTIFVASLLYFTYKIYKLRTKSQSSSVAANHKTFTDTFMIYIVLGYAYTFERLIKYFVDKGSAYVPYDDVSFFEQATYFVEYFIAFLLSFTIFIIRYYDDSTRKKLRILIGWNRESEFTNKLSDGEANPRRKKSENRKIEEESYSAEVKFTINMRKIILISMIQGVSWAFDNAQEIIENVSQEELDKLPKNLNRIEDYLLKEEDLTKDNPQAGELCKKIGVELEDSRISFHNFLMTLNEITSKKFSLEDLKKSFSFIENHNSLDIGFEEKDNTLSWITEDSKYRVDIIDQNLSKYMITFWRDLFEYQKKKSNCTIQPIITVGQYISLKNPTNAFFIIGENYKHDSDVPVHVEESYCVKYNEFSSFADKKKFLELKEYLKKKAYVEPDRFGAYEDVLFLQGHALLFSMIVNVKKLLGGDRDSHKNDTFIQISFQNFSKANSSMDVIKYTQNINTIFDIIYNNNDL